MTYDPYHLNAPIPNLETDSSYLDPTYQDDAGTFVTNECHDDDDEEISLEVPAEVSYESDVEGSEIEEEDDSSAVSSEAEESDESDYESECTLDRVGGDESVVSTYQSADHDHELFLPKGLAPTYENLKYDEEDSSSDEEYTYNSTRVGFRRPMMLMPRYSSNISDDSEEDSSVRSQNCPSSSRGVSFDDTVTVHAVFETEVYTSQMIDSMYTKREELRINKLRNKREYAYDDNDWENVTEECDMEEDEDGELVHPVHTQKRTFSTGPFLSSGSSIWSVGSAQQVQRSKRMRIYYP